MNITELMDEKNYTSFEDLTINDLKELGECITDDMSIGIIFEYAEILYDEAGV